jgi:hypothetical protein
MSLRLSLTPSWFLQIWRTIESVSMGWIMSPLLLVGTLTLLNLRLVRLLYCSCSSTILYGSLNYNYLCKHCPSPLTLWVRIHLRRGILDITLCDKVCQWFATGRWFYSGTPVSSIKYLRILERMLLKNSLLIFKYKMCYVHCFAFFLFLGAKVNMAVWTSRFTLRRIYFSILFNPLLFRTKSVGQNKDNRNGIGCFSA